jgi:integrase
MARGINRLTAKEVEKKTKPGLYGDGGGLTLQITRAGVKSWLFRFMIAGKSYAMGLGPTHTVTLADARAKASDARRAILDGINPLHAKQQKKQDAVLARARLMTFDQCASAYIDAHRPSWKNAKHADQWTNTIAQYASPIIGSMPVAEIDTGLVVKVLTQPQKGGGQFWLLKHETARRVRTRIESILGWATTAGHRTGENPARWKGHLENLLASLGKTQGTKNHPSLEWPRIGSFMKDLRQREGISARAVEFAILTAARSGEVRGAKWSEIDLKSKVWKIPAERMKAKREHEVPLSQTAINLLKIMERLESSDLIFPGTKGQELSDMSLTAVIRRMNNDKAQWTDQDGKTITVHGFRSTFRMWAAESSNYPREVAEHALAHQLPDAVERAYQRGTQFQKRAAMMDEWAKFCGKTSKASTEQAAI